MEDKQEKAEKELFALYKKTKDPENKERDHNAVSVHSQNHGNETI